MKNARQVCMLKEVGELHFRGVPGSVVVGEPILALFSNFVIQFNNLPSVRMTKSNSDKQVGLYWKLFLFFSQKGLFETINSPQ